MPLNSKSLKELIKGNEKFKNTHFPKLEKKYFDLVENGQNPQILFIGCSVSFLYAWINCFLLDTYMPIFSLSISCLLSVFLFGPKQRMGIPDAIYSNDFTGN